MNGYWIVIVSIVLSVLFLLAAVQISQSHEIPYPTKGWEADIYLKVKAQQFAIDKQMIDREIELKKLELDLIRARKEEPYFNQTCILK